MPDRPEPKIILTDAPDDADTAVISGTVRTTGIAESAIAEMLGPDFLRDSGSGLDSLSLAYLPGVPGVDLRVTAKGMPRQRAEALVQQAVVKLRERVSAYVYGEGETDLAAVVLEQCRSAGLNRFAQSMCAGSCAALPYDQLDSRPGHVVPGG